MKIWMRHLGSGHNGIEPLVLEEKGTLVQRKSHIDALGATILLGLMITMAVNQVSIKFVNAAMSPIFQSGFRSLCAIPIVLLYLWLRKVKIDMSTPILIPGIICGVFFASEFALLFTALEYTDVSRTMIFFYTMPVWVAVGAHFLLPDDKLTKQKVMGLVFACAGVVVAMQTKATNPTNASLLGDILSLIGAGFWAGIALVTRATKLGDTKPELQLFYQLVVSALILLPLPILLGDTFRDPTPVLLAIFTWQVVFVVCIGFMTWFWVLSVYPASQMASYSFLSPVFGVILSWLILGETISWTIILALALVATGIVLVNKK